MESIKSASQSSPFSFFRQTRLLKTPPAGFRNHRLLDFSFLVSEPSSTQLCIRLSARRRGKVWATALPEVVNTSFLLADSCCAFLSPRVKFFKYIGEEAVGIISADDSPDTSNAADHGNMSVRVHISAILALLRCLFPVLW